MFTEFSRTRDPAWSHDGERIAFFGNQGLQRMHEATALRLPWKLYLTDPDALSVEEILTGVRYGADLEWSPDDQYLAFSGIYKGEKGIFIMDVADQSVYQVWDFDGAFDWSPDGTQMVVLEPVDKNTETTLTETNVYIITLSLPDD